MKGFNSHTFKKIIRDLRKIKVTVSVPRIATVTEAEITLYGEPVDFVNGVPVKASMYERRRVKLPLSNIIDIYHNDYDIAVVNRDDLMIIVKALSDILDRLEARPDGVDHEEEIFDYVNGFYEHIIKENRDKIETKLEVDKPAVLGLSDTMSINYADRKTLLMDLSDVAVN